MHIPFDAVDMLDARIDMSVSLTMRIPCICSKGGKFLTVTIDVLHLGKTERTELGVKRVERVAVLV